MKILRYMFLAAFVSAILPTEAASSKVVKMVSPDGKNRATISCDVTSLQCRVSREGYVVFDIPSISMTIDGIVWGAGKVRKTTIENVKRTVDFTVWRRYDSVEDNYQQATLSFKDYDVQFRLYNDGFAYRFVGKRNAIGNVNGENFSFRFNADCLSYSLLTANLQNWYEEDYTVATLGELDQTKMSLIPAMVRTPSCSILLAEANLHNYGGMYLRPTGDGFENVAVYYPAKEELFDGTNKLYATERYDYIVSCNLNRSFPWRVAGIFPAGNDTSMLRSELIYLLSEQTDEDYSWIKPGKVLWDWWNHNNITGVDFVAGINTDTYMYMVDYAASNGIPYILIDEGWSARDNLLELNTATDIPAVCAYAKQKGVGVCLWAKWINVDKQLDPAFDMMASWGVKGIKIDFMDRNDTRMVEFYERVARKATECRMLVDFHGSYPNEGMRAKYPNLMTREGVVGLEYNKWSNRATPRHQVIIPYLRQWVGPMDFTPGAMLNAQPETFTACNTEPMSQGTRCHQMAMYVVYESPLQMLSDSPSKYNQYPECFEFLNTGRKMKCTITVG